MLSSVSVRQPHRQLLGLQFVLTMLLAGQAGSDEVEGADDALDFRLGQGHRRCFPPS